MTLRLLVLQFNTDRSAVHVEAEMVPARLGSPPVKRFTGDIPRPAPGAPEHALWRQLEAVEGLVRRTPDGALAPPKTLPMVILSAAARAHIEGLDWQVVSPGEAA